MSSKSHQHAVQSSDTGMPALSVISPLESSLDRKGAMKTKRAAIYVRVSTAEQGTDLQETELKEYCDARGWTVIVYRDERTGTSR